MKRNKRRPAVIAILAACLVLACFLPSCQISDDTGFPPLETTGPDSTGVSETTSGETQGTDPAVHLTVALPMGSEELESLRLLYLARQSGLIKQEPGQYIGLQVLPDDLRQFDNGMTISLVTVPASTGATSEQIDLWRSSGSLPDIIYCRSATESVGLENCLDLNAYLYDNDLISASSIYLPALENCRSAEKLYCIPAMASFPVIYLNRSLLSQLQLMTPSNDWTWTEWQTFAAQAQQAINLAGLSAAPDIITGFSDDEPALNAQLARAVFVMNDMAGLLEWLPASFDATTGWAMWNGQAFDYASPSFNQAAAWLSDSIRAGYSAQHLDDQQLQAAFGTQDAVRSGRILMWAGDSADMDTWRQAGLQVEACLMPSGFQPDETTGQAKEKPGIQISIRSLVVSSGTDNPELAASIAAFLVLDADSLLLQSRYQVYSGLVPLVRDAMAQNTLIGRQTDWSWLLPFAGQMTSASCSGQQVSKNWDAAVEASLGVYGVGLLQAEDDEARAAVIDQMIEAASVTLQEE